MEKRKKWGGRFIPALLLGFLSMTLGWWGIGSRQLAEAQSHAEEAAPDEWLAVGQEKLTGVEIEIVDHQPQVKIAATGKVETSIHYLDQPHRMLLKVHGALLTWKPTTLEVNQPPLVRVRAAQHEEEVWIVLDLTEAVKWERRSHAQGIELIPENFSVSSVSVPPASRRRMEKSAPKTVYEQTVLPESQNPAGNDYQVVDVAAENLGEKTRLTVTTDGQVRYRVQRTKRGHRLSLYIHGASLSWRGPLSGLPKGPVKKVNAYQQREAGESIVKVAVQMTRNSPYLLFRDQNQIVIEFDNPGTIERGAGRKGNLRALMSVDFQNADLAAVLRALAHDAGFDLVLTPGAGGITGVQGMVTVTINQQAFETVLDFILRPRRLAYTISRNILRVGLASEFATKTQVFTMKNLDVKNSNIQETITEAFTEGAKGKVQIDTHNNRVIVSAIPSDMTKIKAIMRDMDVQRRLITRTYDLSYTQPQKIIPMLKASLSSLGSIEKNEQGNSLVITDLPGNMPRISNMISRLDTKAQQVMIEARIVEISRSNKQELGIRWDATSTHPATDPRFTVTSIPEAVGAVATITLGTLKSGVDLNATISMLEAKGAVNTISNPRVATLNNQTATLTASKNIPYQTSMVSNGVVSNVIEYLELPITLTITPQVTKDHQVLLNPLILDVTTIVQEGTPPITSSRSAKTQMLVKDGETIAIGGMVRDEESIKESKVPLLGDIPLLGLLFKSKVKIKEKIELVVFLTPHILE